MIGPSFIHIRSFHLFPVRWRVLRRLGGCTDSDSSDAWMSCPTPAGFFFLAGRKGLPIFFVGKIGQKSIVFSLMITATTNTYNNTILSLMLTRGDLI